jgi:hypothetical protein
MNLLGSRKCSYSNNSEKKHGSLNVSCSDDVDSEAAAAILFLYLFVLFFSKKTDD